MQETEQRGEVRRGGVGSSSLAFKETCTETGCCERSCFWRGQNVDLHDHWIILTKVYCRHFTNTNIYQLKNGHPISRLRIINCNSETVIYISLNIFFIVILPILVILYIYVCMHVGVHFYIFLASIVCSTFVQYWLYSYIYLTFWPVNINVTLTSSVQGQDLLPLRTWCAIPRPASVDSIIHLWPVMSILHL